MPGRSNNQRQPQNQPNNPIPNQPNGPLIPDDDFEGDNLNINELLGSAQPKSGPSLDESRQEVKFVPETRSIEDIASNAVMAVDKEGNQYVGENQIKEQLSKKGSFLFVFDPDGEAPYAYENRKGQLFCSDQGISSHNQLPGHFFVPVGSLDSDRIIGGPTAKRIKKLNNDYVKAKKEYESKSTELERKRRDLNAELAELKKREPKLTVKKPEVPKFSWLRNIQRWAFKIITFGQGETAAYRKYQEDKASYKEKNTAYKEAYKKFKTDGVKYKGEKGKLDQKLEAVEEELEEIRAPLNKAENLKERVIGEHQRSRKEGVKKVRQYRENLEVLVEGAADIIKEGKITKDNVFANTWMKKAACDAKDPSDPDARQALEEYLASKMVEDKLLSQTMSGELDRRTHAENESMLRALNDGSAVKQLREDPIYKDAISEAETMGDLIDAEEIYEDMKKSMAQRAIEKESPVGKLETAKKQLIDEFGKKPITEASMQKVMDLNKLNSAIERAKSDPKKFNNESAFAVITDLYVDPGKQRVYFSDNMTEQETRNAIQSLEGKQEGKTYSLDEMTKMINDTHQAQKKNPSSGPQGLQA